MLKEAALALCGGASVVANAVYDRSRDRAAIGDVACKAGTGFTGIWLEAGADVLRQRVATRSKGASDATTEVLQGQLDRAKTALHPPDEWHKLDAAQSPRAIMERIFGLMEKS